MPENFEKKPNSPIKFPAELTAKDIELVMAQCELQKATSKEQLEGFAKAYVKTKQLGQDASRLKGLTPDDLKSFILDLARLIEMRNVKGLRQIPVSFTNGELGLDAEKIPRALENFCLGYVDFLQDPTEDERLSAVLLYTEFEKIHPFEDGNGRIGDLLWKILETRKSGKWPAELPPDIFGRRAG